MAGQYLMPHNYHLVFALLMLPTAIAANAIANIASEAIAIAPTVFAGPS
jgi:hypothetical protein